MTTMTDHNISDLGTTLEAWVNVVRIDREVGRDPRTDRDAQRALARRNELMDELHGQALAESCGRGRWVAEIELCFRCGKPAFDHI